jgi:uncharacterized membrane protein YfcA
VEIFLPIADQPANVLVLLALGVAVGFLGAMFGVGGGFLMTPFLVFLGIGPGVAVASSANYMAASSFSGALSYWRRRMVDLKLCAALFAGGILGTFSGVWLFTKLRALGQLDLLINVSYLILLTAVGGFMLTESLLFIWRRHYHGGHVTRRRPGAHTWIHGLPLKMRFNRSKLYVSVIPVCAIGYIMGALGAMLGFGGGFLLVPMLIYLLRAPTTTVIGTSNVLTMATMVVATISHAATSHLVDGMLALILMIGGVTGAQFGARAAQRIPAERLRFLLGLLVLAVGIRFAFEVLARPENLFSVRPASEAVL